MKLQSPPSSLQVKSLPSRYYTRVQLFTYKEQTSKHISPSLFHIPHGIKDTDPESANKILINAESIVLNYLKRSLPLVHFSIRVRKHFAYVNVYLSKSETNGVNAVHVERRRCSDFYRSETSIFMNRRALAPRRRSTIRRNVRCTYLLNGFDSLRFFFFFFDLRRLFWNERVHKSRRSRLG